VRCARKVEEIPADLASPRVTIGTFDGVHRGHRAVIERMLDLVRSHGGSSVVVTFEPHPQEVLAPERRLLRLTSFEEKRVLLGELGVDAMAALPFDRPMSEMDAETFFDRVLGRLGVRSLVVGYNFTIGRGREGNLATLANIGNRRGFDVTIVPPVLYEGAPLSSTRIRDSLCRGRVGAANAMLGHAYLVRGRVVGGSGRGRSLGYPTANVEPENPKKLVPSDGVYAVRVRHAGTAYPGVMNVGRRPTFGGGSRQVEVHLMEFEGALYGETLEVEVVDRIRNEKTFSDGDRLRAEIEQDLRRVREIFERASFA